MYRSMVGRVDTPFRIRLARPSDLRHLADIEHAAGTRFAEHLGAAAAAPLSSRRPAAGIATSSARCSWRCSTAPWPGSRRRAGGALVGFAHLTSYDEVAHLEQLAVLPAYGRRGIGGALVRAAMEEARWAGSTRLSLCTFRDLPWNGPFYAGLGFAEVERLEPFQVVLRAAERSRGLDDIGSRVVMDIALRRASAG